MVDDPQVSLRARVNRDCVRTGHPRRVYSSVCRSLSALTRELYVERFKIGITNNPIRRFGNYAEAYDDMILLYRSGSIQNVSDLEVMLIEHNRDLTRNQISGGGGNIGRRGPYFLYVVLCYLREEDLASFFDFVPFVVPNLEFRE